MRIYARIQDKRVAELLRTDADITSMFHPGLAWLDVSSLEGIAVGWAFDGQQFAPSSIPVAPDLELSLPLLQAQFAALGARLAALVNRE